MVTATPPIVKAGALYNSKVASQLLGIHRNTLRAYVKANVIKAVIDKITGRRLYEGRELVRFWNSRIN